jgi:hypothetical protein
MTDSHHHRHRDDTTPDTTPNAVPDPAAVGEQTDTIAGPGHTGGAGRHPGRVAGAAALGCGLAGIGRSGPGGPAGRGPGRGHRGGGRGGLGHRNTVLGAALPVATLAALATATGRSRTEPGALEICEHTFMLLCTGPAPLSLDTTTHPDLPNGRVPLHLLRVRLATTGVSAVTRAAVWAQLVTRARAGYPTGARTPAQADARRATWTVATAAMAAPELLRVCAAVCARYRGEPADIEAAALGGFLAELRRPELQHPAHPRTRHRLLMAAYRAARAVHDTHPHHTPTTANNTQTTSDGGAHRRGEWEAQR